MSNYIKIGKELGAAILSGYALYCYLNCMLEPKKEIKRKFVWIIYLGWQVIESSFLLFTGTINIVATNFTVWLVTELLYDGKLMKKCIFVMAYSCIGMLLETLCGYIFIVMGLEYHALRYAGAMITQILLLSVIFILRKIFSEANVKKLPYRYQVMLLFIPMGSIFIIDNTFHLSVRTNLQYGYKNSFVASCIVLTINIVIFYVYRKLAESLEIRQKDMVYEQQLVLYEQYMQEKEADMQKIREMRHDFKSHLIVIQEYAERVQYGEQQQYIQQLSEGMNRVKFQKFRTDNVAIDSILNYKYGIAMEKKIQFDADLMVPRRLPFRSVDLGILLGNTLDNALEAVDRQKNGEKYIKIEVRMDRRNLKIKIENSFNGHIEKERDGRLKTIKEDKKNHGIGMMAIENVVKRYHGEIIKNIEDEKFMIQILLYDPQQNVT